MKLEYFPEHNIVFAKDQPEYDPLPARVFKNDPQGRVVFCWGLSWRERLAVFFTGKIWHQVLTFHRPLQPQLATVNKPRMEDY